DAQTAPTQEQPPARTTTDPTASRRRPRTVERTPESSQQCTFSVSDEPVTVRSNGGSIIIPVNLSGADPGSLQASTPDWADIAVFAEPKTNIESGIFNYSITSVSKRTGTFSVVFKSPCGTKKITVNVR
ncbi:MAG: hypothetical protein ICV68_09980, partial [Pyrinomonadaceae bacterium]|nr:hypothetical protein [Pyrinomonadaceae bacterium]